MKLITSLFATGFFLCLFLGALFSKCYPIPSMYGVFTYIYHKNQANVGEYTIHGSYGYWIR